MLKCTERGLGGKSMDTFMEKIVEKKKTPKDMAIRIGIVLAALLLVMILMDVSFRYPQITGISPLLWIGAVYGAFYLVRSRNIEYEYIVTNGDLDIDMIVAKRKRKRIFSANCKDFDILARYRGTHYERSMDEIKNRIEAVSTMQAEDIYFIVLNYKGERTIVFFQPTEKMLDSFRKFNPRNVYKHDTIIQGL
jgi:hypothetical protein